MTLSCVAPIAHPGSPTTKTLPEFRYDVRLEVGVKPGSGTIPVATIFHDLVKRMKSVVDSDKPLAILTTTDHMFIEKKEMSSDEFQKEFKLATIDGKNSKVMLGFKLRSMTPLHEIKQRLLKDYLIPHDLFLKEQVGGFNNGLETHMYGFLKQDHPDHPDRAKLAVRFMRIVSDAWKKMDKDDKKKWKETLPALFYADGVAIPVNFVKERLAAEVEGKEKIVTHGLIVTTPKKYGQFLRQLLDIAILGKKLNNLIPFAYQREDPSGYYHLVAEQARFMEQHRNIPVLNVPYDAPNKKGIKGEPLDQVLYTNKHILRVAYDPKNERYHISTHAQHYRAVHSWINDVLKEHQFPFQPLIRPMKYSGTGTNGTKYAAVFADAVSVANESYDASTIKTTRSQAWKQRPPLDISYELTAEAFPPLPAKRVSEPTTPSTMSETLDEDTIQSAISSAIKTIQEQHRAEMDRLKLEMQTKMDAMENKLKEIGKQVVNQTYEALITDESPLVTKTDHARLQSEMSLISKQLSTLIQMISNGGDSSNMTSDQMDITTSPPRTGKRLKKNLTPQKPGHVLRDFSTQESDIASATSSQDEGMEGCEE